MKRLTTLMAGIALLISACTTQERAEWRLGPVPGCDTTSKGRLLLMAQSAPDAVFIPCVGDLPAGWDLTTATSRTGRSILVFTTDTFDLDVDVVLTTDCDMSAARELDSSRPETRLFAGPDGKSLIYTFAGGCITYEYETRQLADSPEGRALVDAVPFMTRDELRERSGWSL